MACDVPARAASEWPLHFIKRHPVCLALKGRGGSGTADRRQTVGGLTAIQLKRGRGRGAKCKPMVRTPRQPFVTFAPMACGISFQSIESARFEIFPEML